jgi:outer membrane protein OmpA-like peptidoglycan-associated protein
MTGKWCVTAAMGVLLALPGFAQQRSTITGDEAAATKPLSGDPAPARSFAALPDPPRATPFPGPAASNGSEPGRLVPRFEVSGMYDYVNFSPGGSFENFNNHGASASFTYNANKWLGFTAELGGYHHDIQTSNPNVAVENAWMTYFFGPRVNLRRFDRFVPFAEIMVGGAHGGSEFTGAEGQDVLAMLAGGGVDVVLTRNIAWRFAQLDYLMTNFTGPVFGPSNRQHNFRAGSGLVVRWGFPPPPPPPNRPPVAACSANPSTIFVDSTEPVAVHVNASDPDNDPLTYSYTATGGTVEGTGADARWNPAGVSAGTYTVNVKVDDGKGGTATCAADIIVQVRPNRPPTISCTTDRNPILPGERTGITSVASDPDNDPLTFSYTTTGGQIIGEGPKVQFDSTGLQPGSYTVKCAVSDGRGGTAEASTTVDVQQPPPPPQATKVGDCSYGKPGSSRVDNVCKRVLDDVALRLKNDPNAKLVITGYADRKEPKAAKLADTRADLARKYLGEKGIDASRITTRTGTASTEKGAEKENRRIDFVFVPEGATY